MTIDTREPNHLIHEKSPYLLQHAHNPVDWYPWGKEAFEKAVHEDKPIFLSIGYSTCHWCHVMEHESFEDHEVAQVMNRDFVAIKVDKEERPDIDAVYMAVCQAMTSQGGWPLTILMSPEQKPFFAGTYFPKHSRYPMMGVMELLDNVGTQWKSDKTRLLESSEEITKLVQASHDVSVEEESISFDIIEQGVSLFKKNFDKTYGGFSTAPKFPTAHNLLFLLRYYHHTKDQSVLDMVDKTLLQMYCGGIFDHIGFGFSRYSTDKKWLVPHFEKMLYDNALLIIAYLEAYQIAQNDRYKTVATKTLHYVMRELMSKEGGYFCAQDADSDGVEGKYYVFTPQEVISVLGTKDGDIFNRQFQITQKGNFEGSNIPNLIGSENIDYSQNDMKPLFDKLYEFRKDRTTLHKDDKILTSWNALMMVALAKAYQILKDDKYLKSAEFVVECVDLFLTDKNGKLQTSYRDGKTSGAAHLDDYAFWGWAYLELYQTTFQVKWLERAISVTKKMVEEFWDEDNGGFFLSGKENETLIMQVKELYDGAIPSGNSVAAYTLVALAKLTGDISWQKLSDRQLAFGASTAKLYPAGYSFLNIALMTQISLSKELVCVVSSEDDVKLIQEVLHQNFMPNVFVLIKNKENEELLATIAPFTKEYKMENHEMTFYLCQNNSCSAPFHGIENLNGRLRES